MDNFKKFIEALLDSKIKDLNRLSGGASAETYKICLSDHKNYILRKTPDSAESVSYTHLTLPTTSSV